MLGPHQGCCRGHGDSSEDRGLLTTPGPGVWPALVRPVGGDLRLGGGGWTGLVGDPGNGHLPYWVAPGVRGEQELELGQSFPGPSSQEFTCSTTSAANDQRVGVLCPSATPLPPRQVSSLSSPWAVSDGFFAFLLWTLALASSRRPEPSSVEVEPKKLKGKRELFVTKGFQQVDFWCKWSGGSGQLLLSPRAPCATGLGILCPSSRERLLPRHTGFSLS